MSKQVTINKSFYDKLLRLEEIPAEAIEEKAHEIATTATSLSPVDTGAYITSHSIVAAGAGGGRSRTSHNKPRNQSFAEKQSEALGQLNADIAAIDFKLVKKFTLRNRAPHANVVEKKYSVFAAIRNIHG